MFATVLENREMTLEDGRLMLAADRYDELAAQYPPEELARRRLLRVSEDFRVIALGLPVPTFVGRALDPPLRSRFQARAVEAAGPAALAGGEGAAAAGEGGAELDGPSLERLLGCGETLRLLEQQEAGKAAKLPHLADPALVFLRRHLAFFPALRAAPVIGRAYPAALAALAAGGDPAKAQQLVDGALGRFGWLEAGGGADLASQLEPTPRLEAALAPLLPEQREVVRAMLCDHGCLESDGGGGMGLCVVGGPGSGKSTIARAFAAALGYGVATVHFFRDMTSRELLQRRGTDEAGTTRWENTALVRAAVRGELALLDGIHRVAPDVIAMLQRLLHDRDLELFDGTRLLRHDRFAVLLEQTGLTEDELAARQIFRVHPAFRVVALAEPPASRGGSVSGSWLTSETLGCFVFHTVPELGTDRQRELLLAAAAVDDKSVATGAAISMLVDFGNALAEEVLNPTSALSGSRGLSLRQLKRISARAALIGGDSESGLMGELGSLLDRATLRKFLPRTVADSLGQLMANCGIDPIAADAIAASPAPVITELVEAGGGLARLRIGDTEVQLLAPTQPELIPRTLFYENASHLRLLREMLRDLAIFRERAILLIGNQGTGKNKLTDKLLMLMQREREYLQLHRDTTVQSLTTAPSLEGGAVLWLDSPLVRAVRNGWILVVDEADKAPVEVVTILKSLVEDGEMLLSDGKKIVPTQAAGAAELAAGTNGHPLVAPADVIVMHPDFRMIILANRPGYPFLGNDFFREIGDVLSCHVIDNPDRASELTLLRSYGPDVPDVLLQKLASAFAELRQLNEAGTVTYPYSTRELVAVVKHLQSWPADGLVGTLSNVLAFDQFDNSLMASLRELFQRHGIPLGIGEAQISEALSLPQPLPPAVPAELWRPGLSVAVEVEVQPLTTVAYKLGSPETSALTGQQVGRLATFSEELRSWDSKARDNYGLWDAVGLAVTGDGGADADSPNAEMIHVLLSTSPLSLVSVVANGGATSAKTLRLQPEGGMGYRGGSRAPLSHPDLCALRGKALLASYDPNHGELLLLDPARHAGCHKVVGISNLCPGKKAFGPPSRDKEVLASMRRHCMVQSRELEEVDRLLFFERAGRSLVLIDLRTQMVTHISLTSVLATEAISTVGVVSAGRWLLQASAVAGASSPHHSALGYVDVDGSGSVTFTPVARSTIGGAGAVQFETLYPGAQDRPASLGLTDAARFGWAVPAEDGEGVVQVSVAELDPSEDTLAAAGAPTASGFIVPAALQMRALAAATEDVQGQSLQNSVALQVVDAASGSYRRIVVDAKSTQVKDAFAI